MQQKTILAGFLLTSVSWGMMFSAWPQNKSNQQPPQTVVQQQSNLVQSLDRKVRDSPSNPSPDTVRLMDRVGATKRLDAALVLVKALAFNHDPDNTDEVLSQSELIPSIGILKRYYGKQVLPLLYTAGIRTDKVWLQERCALACQHIASPTELNTLSEAFSLNTTQNQKAKSFGNLLKEKNLQVFLFSPTQTPIRLGP